MDTQTTIQKLNQTLFVEMSYDRLMIFRTDINTKKKLASLQSYFDNHPFILRWNIDRQDIDNVLRLETLAGFNEFEFFKQIHFCGLHCEELED